MRFSTPIAISLATLAAGAAASYGSYDTGAGLYARDADYAAYDELDPDLYARDAEPDFDDDDFELYARDADVDEHKIYARAAAEMLDDNELVSVLAARSLGESFDADELERREAFIGGIIKGITKGVKGIVKKVKGKKNKGKGKGKDAAGEAAQQGADQAQQQQQQ